MFTHTTTSAGYGATALDYLASTAAEAVPASTLADDTADRIAIAALAELDDIVRDMRLDHTAGRLSVDEMEILDEAARMRRADLAEATRAARRRTRRRLHEPRPVATPEERARVGQWKAEIKAAVLAGYISEVDPSWGHELLTFPSVAAGGWCMASDATFGRKLRVSGSSARRRRRRFDRAGLVEIISRGEDGNSCLVRPILRDGTPVFGGSEMPTRPVTSDQGGRSHVTADTLATDIHKTEPSPPLPPEPAAPPEEGEGQSGSSMKEGRQAQPEPAEPLLAEVRPAQPSTTDAAPAGPAAAMPPDAVLFAEFWQAIGRRGEEGFATAEWLRLSVADKAAIGARLRHPHFRATTMFAGTWLKGRKWEAPEPEAPPTVESMFGAMPPGPEPFYAEAGSPEMLKWEAQFRAERRSMWKDDRGGRHFPSRWPPESEEARADTRSVDEIRAAMLAAHPDRGGSNEAFRKVRPIYEAARRRRP